MPTATPPLTRTETVVLLEALIEALEYDFGAAEPLLTRLRAGIAGQVDAVAVEKIAAAADVFDTDSAVEGARRLKDELARSPDERN